MNEGFVKIKMPEYYIAKHSDEDLRAAVLAEREACAKLCDHWASYGALAAEACAESIRARSKHE